MRTASAIARGLWATWWLWAAGGLGGLWVVGWLRASQGCSRQGAVGGSRRRGGLGWLTGLRAVRGAPDSGRRGRGAPSDRGLRQERGCGRRGCGRREALGGGALGGEGLRRWKGIRAVVGRLRWRGLRSVVGGS
ncbi:hypothetical protein GUJ93_ZPchr0013g37840 [Zizania palustris]|uniref:Uncharacterized protein n=1 Tax=Zizania palustris TaxID=103762 RepID=A0A8J6C6A9_ZIZPA|nr:hypothetical protein GUJ93_ZPchr0013g37840 [Zizania palustris]